MGEEVSKNLLFAGIEEDPARCDFHAREIIISRKGDAWLVLRVLSSLFHCLWFFALFVFSVSFCFSAPPSF
jgi:hypothetical protein